MDRTWKLALVLLVPLAACRTNDSGELSPRSSVELWQDAAGSVADPDLAALCTDAWEYQLAHDPEWATRLGDPRYNGELSDNSLAGMERHAQVLRGFLRRAERISPASLPEQDRITLEICHRRWSDELAAHELGIDLASWNLEPRSGVHVDFLSLAPDQPVATPQERQACLRRWSKMPLAIDRQIANLERGLANGRVSSRAAVCQVIAQLEAILATPVEESPLSEPGVQSGPNPILHEDLGTRIALLATIRNDIYPAYRRYRDVLEREVLPRARDDDHPGVCWVAGGGEYYRLAVARHTTLALTPEEIHAIGRAEVERIRAEMSALGRKVLGTSDLAEIQRRLRTDPALHFATRDEVLAEARACLARAQAAVPSAFGLRPRAPCEVVPVPDHEAPYQTIAYYREPAADGSRPGRYYVNTWAPETRPRYEAEVLAYHESVPGHHLQIAIAQELEGLPLVRRYNDSTAFVEGWALYTERLSDELGLYEGDFDRLGCLSFDAWRACRLVVDTGLHALGWTRQQAIDYMVENTLLALNNIANEVDRYIAWPGQALAYKLGQREVLALRAEAEQALGRRFRLADFHDRVLENGGVPLSLLREEVERWIRKAAPQEIGSAP